MLDVHQLNVFLVAAETLNFTQAAARLHMTQPSISQHVQSLEQYFDQKLFIRSGRHIRLSAAGEALLPLARDLVNRAISIEETMKSLEGEVHGHLLVGCSTTPGKYILPHLLARFHGLHPRVTLSCHVASQTQALQMVCDDEAHFALVSVSDLPCNYLEMKRFMMDPVMLIAPLGHPWATRQEIEPEELVQAQFILREAGSGTQETVRQGLDEIGIDMGQLKTLLVLGNSEAIAIAVQEGLGVGFVSSIVYTRLVQGRVAPVRVRGLQLEREICIARNMRRMPTAAQASFWEFINAVDDPIAATETQMA
ncbi:MAG: LysR family transcriptional regulator [Anaerolineales bacterium]|nr:LysR family transcriptional regulator [Anaerolineales bacterium]